LAGSTEVKCTKKWLAKILQERYFQNARKKGIQAGGLVPFLKKKLS